MSKIICPVCKSEVVLPDKSEVVVGTTISKEGNDTFVLNMKEKEKIAMNNAEGRKVTLEKNGISTEGYFSLKLPSGKTVYVDENGDKVDVSIVGGNIGNAKLYRRWVMAQWFRQNNNPNGYADTVSRLTYEYQWKVVANELKALAKLESTDKEAFEERVHFFSISQITFMLKEYKHDLERKIRYLETRNCKGIPYYHISGKNIFVTDIRKKLLNPLNCAIENFSLSKSYTVAYDRFMYFKRHFLNVYKPDIKYAGRTFKDCYKGAGAYYTLQNMVLYHGCTLGKYIEGSYGRWDKVCEFKDMDAYCYMKTLLDEFESDGWRWVGVLRQCIADNNFSFSVK